MCCFSAKTEVHGTTIFARMVKPGTQLLAYQMKYTAATPTAMILPVPVALPAREDAVRFKSLKEYPTFFGDLEKGFPAPAPRLRGMKSAPEAQASTAAAAPLAVHDVGDFVASFVPSIADFSRVDPRFAIKKDVWDKIPAYKDYGFAVFQLKELEGSPHPIAFELDTRLDGTIFFPTVHIHDGSVHEKDDFDHALYLQAPVADRHAGSYEGPDAVDAATGFVRSKGPAKEFADAARSQGMLDPDLLVHKITMRGSLPNRDVLRDLRPTAFRAGGCSRCDVAPGGSVDLGGAAIPVGLTMAGLGWIIRRRDALRGRG
ncbi:MAG: hypothetical protein JST00_15580 [Deltaproteobacteria bacterium]|nr:hypothetical protein [Deltaproteobacteria bacterium]